MAGTTIDEHGDVYRSLKGAATGAGADITDADVQEWMGAAKDEAIWALLEKGGVTPTAELVAQRFAWFEEDLHRRYAENAPVALPGVADAVRALRASGRKVSLTTGFSRDVADAILAQLGWGVGEAGTELEFDAVVTADEAALGRPAPYLIHRAMERTGVLDVAEVLSAGDTVNDVLAARRSGGRAIAVLTGKLGEAELEAAGPDAVLASVAELPAWLEANA